MTRADVRRSVAPDSRWFAAGLAVVCASTAGLVFATLAAPESIWSARLIDHPGYAPVDAIAVQDAWPAHLADLTGLTWLAGVGAVLLVFALVRRMGGGSLAAAAAALGMAFGGIFWSRAAGGQPATFGALLALATLAALLWWRDRRRPIALASAAAALGVTIATQPSTLLALPVVLVAAATAPGLRARHRLAALGPLVAAAIAGGVWASRTLGMDAAADDWLLPHGLPALTQRLATAGSLLVSDFGVLGLGFLIAGVAVLATERRGALALVAGWCLFVGQGGLLWGAPDWRSNALPALAPAWVVVGAGMYWLLTRSGGARPVAAGLILLLPAASFAGHYWMGARANTARRFVTAYFQSLPATLAATPIVIAEGGAIDRVLESADAGDLRGWTRVAQDPALIEAHLASGRPVLGFDVARANLAALGFRFRPVGGTGVPMTPDQLIDTVPPGWIVAIAAGDRFGQWLPRRTRPGLGAIGAVTQTFGSRGRYAAIGVKDSNVEALEQFGAQADVMVRAGDAARGVAMRWPARVRALSDADGGVVEYAGRPVARTSTGIALAVLSPAGVLAGAFSTEFNGELSIPVRPSGFRAALVAGREPCAAVVPDRWTDVSGQTRLSSLSALLEPEQRIVAYLASDRRLTPRAKRLRHAHTPGLQVESFDTSDPSGAGALAAAMSRDSVIDDSAIGSGPLVFRIDIAAQPSGRSQLALQLGGSAGVAVARLVAPGGTRSVDVCGVMRGGAGLFAGADAVVEEIDLANAELLPYGWDRLEHSGIRRRRWTRVHEADVLVPLSRVGPIALEIDIEPAGPAGARLDIAVNGVAMPSTALRDGVQTYQFSVPAEAWREGMNLMTIATSTLVRPSDVSASRDDRQLGLAVSAIRLAIVDAYDQPPGTL